MDLQNIRENFYQRDNLPESSLLRALSAITSNYKNITPFHPTRAQTDILSTLNVAYREGNEANRHCHIDRMHLRVLFMELQNIHSGLKASAVVDPEVIRIFKTFRMSYFNLRRVTHESWFKLIPLHIFV